MTENNTVKTALTVTLTGIGRIKGRDDIARAITKPAHRAAKRASSAPPRPSELADISAEDGELTSLVMKCQAPGKKAINITREGLEDCSYSFVSND